MTAVDHIAERGTPGSRMTEHMMQGMQLPMLVLWAVMVLAAVALVAVAVHLARPARSDRLLVADLAANSLNPNAPRLTAAETKSPAHAEAHDTIFILPDISNYTRFMTGNHFAFGHAQHVIFSLINAMIDAATKTVELSKLEGDAALFFVDAKRHSDAVIGETVMCIFRAFFQERKRLAEANICVCRACRHINQLDLKIFVHRGRAARFEFRGTVDHFGTDVIVLHRMMKNSVSGHRYVMVTEAATDSISLPGAFETFDVEEHVEHVGGISASVFVIDDATVAELSNSAPEPPLSALAETSRKLQSNLRSIKAEGSGMWRRLTLRRTPSR